mmetsp:Transcript_55223/g.131169  ORF Transcript_55223/g.131169 Transcript_55223/m.131169 type:complete len:447 (+) Transcript_55223:61-1401(+)
MLLQRANTAAVLALICAASVDAFLAPMGGVAQLCAARSRSVASRGKVAMAQSSTATGALREARAAKDMRFNKLGDSDLLVSEVCLGTMTWGKQTSEQDALDQLNLSFDEYGVNFLDTAEGYPIPLQPSTSGATDLMIGKWLKTRERSKVIVASKVCGASKRLNWFRDDKAATRVTKKQVKESVEKSLKRLGTDYIDLLQIHWPDRYVPLFGPNKYDYRLEVAAVPFEEQLEAMAELIQEGKVRNWGLSNETPFGVMAFASLAMEQGLPKAVSVQNSYSLLTREFDSAMAEVCSPSHTNTPLIPYSPLSAGVLTGKYELSIAAASAKFSENQPTVDKSHYEGSNPDCRLNLLKGYRTRYQSSLAPQAIAEYAGVAAKYGMSMSHLALAFVASRPFVPSTIVGATSTAQLEDNIQAFQLEFTEEMLADIDEVASRFPDPWRTPQPGGG